MNNKFESLSLKKELLTNLKELEYNVMTPIQESALPVVLKGEDVIAQAKTGSGKTAVFGLGILDIIDTSKKDIQALILCPTRELAEQVAVEIRKLARILGNVKVLTLCGGVSEYHQERSLFHGAHIIVGTPGRIKKHYNKNTLNFDFVETFVLDEADRMLDMGFFNEIMDITKTLPLQRQTLLFSATYPDTIEELGKTLQHEAKFIKVDTEHVENVINQIFFKVEGHKQKEAYLLKLLSEYREERVIVFCKTKQITEKVTKFLNSNNILAVGIHGDVEQNERTSALTMFSNESISVLVATDVASRGLDINDLGLVINFDIPIDSEVYVHRIGRTGRAGKTGLALSLFVEQEQEKINEIENRNGIKNRYVDINSINPSKAYDLLPPMKTIYIGGGKKNKLRPGDILGAIVGESGIDSCDVGNITILDIISYVAIKRELIDTVVIALQNGKIKNRKFKVGNAQ